MYTRFYGLREKPFKMTPDPRFLYYSENHKEALAQLKYGLQERNGFVALTGEVGTGKTTLLYTFLSGLNGNVKTVLITNPNLSIPDFFHLLGSELGLTNSKSKSDFLIEFKEYIQNSLSKHEIVLLIIDEAQNLSCELLEEIRLLSNLETPSSKLLQIVLSGQQELNNKLNMVSQRQLKQRIGLKYNIKPLSYQDTRKYIQTRLHQAGCKNNEDLFTKKAIKYIYRYSEGVPRVINLLCDHALITGWIFEEKRIDHSIIKEIVEEEKASYLMHHQAKGFAKKSYKSSIILLFISLAILLGFLGWSFWV